jgi:hypothetical protein
MNMGKNSYKTTHDKGSKKKKRNNKTQQCISLGFNTQTRVTHDDDDDDNDDDDDDDDDDSNNNYLFSLR